MEMNESNPKPQATGGLNILTIFIVVLTLHVLAIGGVTIYYFVKGGSSDADLVSDKEHKSVKIASEGDSAGDGQLPDASADKSAIASSSTPSPADANDTPPITIPVPANPPAPASTPVPAPTANDSVTQSDSVAPADASAAPAPISPVNEPTASTPSGPIRSGPVIAPPASATPAPAPAPAADLAAEPPSTPAAAPEPETTGGTPYTVKSRDSLARIAHQHRISVARLKAANGLKSDLLQIGQKLTIPDRAPSSSAGLATLREPGTPLLGDTNSAPPRAKPVASLPRDEGAVTRPTSNRHVYTVVKGDTLIKIAHKFHTTPNAILGANGSVDARKLRIGQKLRIPSQEPRSANSTPVAAPAPQDPGETGSTPSGQLANFIP